MSSQSSPSSEDDPQSGPAVDQPTTDQRDARARREDMDIALLKQGGIYAVTGVSGQTYRVDITDKSCTCPDAQERDPQGGCKHVRRVKLELDWGTIPRPDGKLPARALEMVPVDESDKSVVSDADYQQERAAIIDVIQEREEEIAHLQSEIEALEFVTDVLETIADPDAEFSLDALEVDR